MESETPALLLADLPTHVLSKIASFLLPGERLLLQLVCHALRAAVSSPGAWSVLDLTPSGLCGGGEPSDALINALVTLTEKAGGLVGTLRCAGPKAAEWCSKLIPANAVSLRCISLLLEPSVYLHLNWMYALSSLVPQATFEVSSVCAKLPEDRLDNMACFLRGEAPFSSVRAKRIFVVPERVTEEDDGSDDEQPASKVDVESLARFIAAIPSHPSLCGITLKHLDLSDADLVFAAAASLSSLPLLRDVALRGCWLAPPHCAGALATLLRSAPRLAALIVDNNHAPVFGEGGDDAAALPLALRASRLVRLDIDKARLWGSPAVGVALVDALVGHPTLTALPLALNSAEGCEAAASEALARLVSATNPPCRLEALSLPFADLQDAGIALLMDAIRSSNSSLLELNIRHNLQSGSSDGAVLAAVAAHPRLCRLAALSYAEGEDLSDDHVASRAAQAKLRPLLAKAEAAAAARGVENL